MSNEARLTGIEARFEALLKSYGSLLRSVILRVCPRNLGLEVHDIEQDARLRLWRAIESEREVADPASYIYRIAVTAAIDATRRVVARHEEQLAEEESEDGGINVGTLAAPPGQSPARIAERRLLIDKIEKILMRLQKNRRIAVELHLQEMTTNEIAELTGWSEPKARNLVYRGLKDLREELRREGIDYET